MLKPEHRRRWRSGHCRMESSLIGGDEALQPRDAVTGSPRPLKKEIPCGA
jgi:hypothetical protein